MTDKEQLIEMYESQMRDHAPIMNEVLKAAIETLKRPNSKRQRVEKWVVGIEKAMGKF